MIPGEITAWEEKEENKICSLKDWKVQEELLSAIKEANITLQKYQMILFIKEH